MKLRSRIISAALAAVMAVGVAAALASCGGSAPQKTKLEHVYDYTPVKMKRSDVENGLDGIKYYDGRIYYTSYGELPDGRGWGQRMYSVAEDGSDKKEYTPKLVYDDGSSNMQQYAVCEKGIYYVEGKWSWDESTQTSSSEFYLHLMDFDGAEISVMNMTDELKAMGLQDYGLERIIPAGSDILCTTGTNVIVIRDEKVEKKIEVTKEGYVNGIFCAKNGDIWVAYYEYGAGDNGASKLKKLNIATGAVEGEGKLPTIALNNIYNASSGPDYDLYFATNLGFFGCNFGDAEPTEICNWMNSDISANYISYAAPLPDGRLFVAPEIYSQLNSGTGDSIDAFYLMTKRPDDKNVEKFILTFGCVYLDGEIRNAISRFNRDSDEYRITVRDYSIYSTENDWNASYTKLNQDLVTGNSPDIIYVTDQMPYNSYAAKGVFADLSGYIESDPDIHKEDYLENILYSTSVGGKLYSIFPAFSISTLACKKSLVEKALGRTDITGIDMDEFNKILDAMPDARAFSTYGRNDFLYTLTNTLTDMYIDKDTGKCSFDSPDFVALLEFVKSMPEKSVYDDIDYEDYDESVYQDIEMMYINDEAVFAQTYISQYSSYWQQKMGQFGGDMMLVGFPCSTKDGAMLNINMELAIGGTSKFKDQAWQFIRYFLLDDYQENLQWQFPVKKSAMNKLADKALNPPKEGEDGYYYSMDTYWIGGQEVRIGNIDQEGVDYLNNYLASITNRRRSDEKISTIITEETDAFFKGIKSAEECAKLIQNRVQTYVSEQR